MGYLPERWEVVDVPETYPTLSRFPKLGFPKETLNFDPSLKTQPEDGKVLSRSQYTTQKKEWEIEYDNMPEADKTLLTTMQTNTNVGADTITWENPQDEVTYTVRLDAPIKFKLQATDSDLWEIAFKFVEA